MSESILREEVLPAAFTTNGYRFVDCEFDSNYEAQDNFQSTVFFVTAEVQKNQNYFKIPLVVKFQPKDESVRKLLNTGDQFYNEVFMYRELLPIINKSGICEGTFPKFYYGIGASEDPCKDVIAIEDLRPKGFRLTDEKGFIDLQHLKLALQKLGRFHALSYIAKEETPTEFYKMVGKLKEPCWIDPAESSTERSGWSMLNSTIQKCFHRALDPLIAADRHAEVLRRLRARVDDDVVTLVRELVAPEEPAALLCHGDFCRNNMLFRYDSDGMPVDVSFFDVATARYSSPAIDIAFFLLMNSSAPVRAAHWDELLAAYHASLSSTCARLSPGVPVLTLDALHREMRLKAVYGFVHASFFLPMMLWGKEMKPEGFSDLQPEEMGCVNASLGGEEGTTLLMDMVVELVERGCLTLEHPFLKHAETRGELIDCKINVQ